MIEAIRCALGTVELCAEMSCATRVNSLVSRGNSGNAAVLE